MMCSRDEDIKQSKDNERRLGAPAKWNVMRTLAYSLADTFPAEIAE
jgi:hypothetical protein